MFRNMIFVSHANPEDNVFARWLTLRLAREGFPVWCDLTKLLGGEDFWKDIEQAIRERTAKFLFVLSRASNVKDGALQELHLAKGVQKRESIKDFVIPLKIDDLPYGDVNIELSRINGVDFSASWSQGLLQLLKKFLADNIAKDSRFTASAVTDWWRSNFSAGAGVSNVQEGYLSNWFPFELPTTLQIHGLRRSEIGPLEVDSNSFGFPACQDGIDLISFAPAQDLKPCLASNYSIAYTHEVSTVAFLQDEERRMINQNIIKTLLKRAWHLMLFSRGELLAKQMANNVSAFVFKRGFQQSEFVSFEGINGLKQRRQLVGYKTLITGGKRYWHFGFDVRPRLFPFTCFIFTSHVLFSDEGLCLWDNPRQSHRARRSQCKAWYNDDWRDRLLAAIGYFAVGGKVLIPVSSRESLQVAKFPILFTSPVSYSVPEHLDLGDQKADDFDETEDLETSWDGFPDEGETDHEGGEIL